MGRGSQALRLHHRRATPHKGVQYMQTLQSGVSVVGAPEITIFGSDRPHQQGAEHGAQPPCEPFVRGVNGSWPPSLADGEGRQFLQGKLPMGQVLVAGRRDGGIRPPFIRTGRIRR